MRGFLLTLLVFWSSSPAFAQYEGEWRAGPLQIRHEVRSWGPDCGPRPPATSSRPGGTVQISQHGDHLRFSGAVRGATNRCWSDKPGIRRVSVSFQGQTWTVRCQTPEGDAQPEQGRYVFRASGDTIRFEEETTWNWRLRNSNCQATRRARRTLTRVTATESPDPAGSQEPRCASPGPPARIRLRPRETVIAPGERTCIRAQVVDAAGCPLANHRISLELRMPPGVSAGAFDGRCFTAGERAAEAEGVFRVVAHAGEMHATAEVEVRSEDLSDLTARRVREGRHDIELQAEAEDAAGVSARTVKSSNAWLWAGGGLALLVVLFGVALLTRRRKATDTTEAAHEGATAAQPRTRPTEESTPTDPSGSPPPDPAGATARPPLRVCALCGHEDQSGDAFCPNDGSPLLDPGDPAARAQGMICPVCRRGYGPQETTCRQDGEALMPYALFVARQKRAEQAVRKVCPTCGTTYEAATAFCGKDGTALETLN